MQRRFSVSFHSDGRERWSAPELCHLMEEIVDYAEMFKTDNQKA